MAKARQTPSQPLADLVLDRGLTTPETLARARLVQAETQERLDCVLTRLGLVSEQALAAAIAQFLGLPQVSPADFPAEPIVAGRGPTPRFLRDVRAVPLRLTEAAIEVAFVDPFDPYPAAALALAFDRPVLARVAKAGDVEAALDRLHQVAEAEAPAGEDESAADLDLERLKDLSSDAPVVRMVNALIGRAVEARASDIHLEPAEDRLAVRLRIDGALRDDESLPNQVKTAVVSRIKVMSGLDIAERRLPQDGRLRLAVRGQEIDFRVATAPTIHGESVVLRILDRSSLSLDFNALGFTPDLLREFLAQLNRPHGIVLVTGPTGSGKTTTLYTALAALNAPERKILTIEDPIEYRLAGISQTQVKHQIGLSFAAALRSFLRLDPDVIMVGEVRDLETAQVAVQAALTGHAILSTLHTNDAASAVTRLLDMGVEPFLITSTLNAVLAQRLVRRLCPQCRERTRPHPDTLAALGLPAEDSAAIGDLYRPVGCPACGGSGYRGRLSVMELLPISDEIVRLVLARAEAREIRKAAIAAGMVAMFVDGARKAAAGLTTLDEILRVTREE
ncbi:GspE/PulE family protein [Magnetospirillum fulvum]|uniref:Type II secretion system protein E (GspE) n=1 Tax=Magnetospirillum fulvum TaxID=1082 RepID=A0A1H6IH31_MAGFU|nr:ATPase, T2SS/T4P/T4SS family [Magnetospirillum fulvum]SEH48121.1 type II secretion system protein E (GspE) [Magnetospirillum fulvum]